MKLSEIIKGTGVVCDSRFSDTEITDVCNDSRKAVPSTMFVCIKGYVSDGHDFASSAYVNGCRVFVAENNISLPAESESDDSLVIMHSDDTRAFLALASANLFSHPADCLTTIAITGTKGKTSTLCMIASVLTAAGRKVGTIGTLGTFFGDKSYHNGNSTPESYLLQKYFREMVDSGIDTVVMEASSQGFKLHRTYGIDFDIGIFTNLSPDHIGATEHENYEEYRDCKKMLFASCKNGFINRDDVQASYMAENAKGNIMFYGITDDRDCDYRAENVSFFAKDGKLFSEYDYCHGKENERFTVSHPGKPGVYNTLCAAAVCSFLGVDTETVIAGLKSAVVNGRNEIFTAAEGFTVMIDYAFNEISIKSLFDTMEPFRKARIITVFGCGGGKSRVRRFAMGDVITRHSDLSVITSDNPRFDSLDDIIADIRQGITNPRGEITEIRDRKKAIEYALANAKKDDIVLIVGKGHENYEEVMGVKYPFDEKQIVRDCLKKLQDS